MTYEAINKGIDTVLVRRDDKGGEHKIAEFAGPVTMGEVEKIVAALNKSHGDAKPSVASPVADGKSTRVRVVLELEVTPEDGNVSHPALWDWASLLDMDPDHVWLREVDGVSPRDDDGEGEG